MRGDKESKMEALRALVSKYNAKVSRSGRGPVVGFGKDIDVGVKKFCRFGIDKLDEMIFGVPCGQFTVMAGPQQSGKSTLVARLVANVQRRNGIACWVDAEHQLDPAWMEVQGVNVRELLIINDSYLEPTLDKVREVLSTEAVNLIVVDSITALGSLKEIQDKKDVQRSLEDDSVAVQARKISQFFRMSCALVSRATCAVVCIAQVRCPIGTYGSFEMIPGGKALEHYCSLRMRVRRSPKAYWPKERVGKKDVVCGFGCVVKLDKRRSTKTMVEGTEVLIPFFNDRGFDNEAVVESQGEEVAEENKEW